jgi:Pilin accessory protein (PilO)
MAATIVFHNAYAFGVNGITLVSGLAWFTESGLSRKQAETKARVDGKEFGRDAFATRAVTTKNVQFGVISSGDASRKSAVYSAAAYLADAAKSRRIPATWAGAFKLDDSRYLFISIRDNAILPDGDKIVSRDVAENLLIDARAASVETIVADAAFGITGSLAIEFADFIYAAKLKPRSEFQIFRPGDKAARSTKLFIIPIVALALIGAGVAGWMWWQEQELLAAQKAAELRAKTEAARKGVVQTILPAAIWEGQPSAIDVARTCWAMSQSSPTSPAGWLLEKVECDQKQATRFFARQSTSGSVAALEHLIPQVSIDDSGRVGLMLVPLSVTPLRVTEALPSLDDSKYEFLTAVQRGYLKYSLSQPQAPQLPPPPPGQTFAAPTWKLRNFTLEGFNSDPATTFAALQIPGQRVSKVTISGNRLTIEGTLYAQ